MCFPVWVTLAEDQLPDFPKQRRRLLPQHPLQFFLPLDVRQAGQLPARELEELVHLLVDVGPARRGRRLSPGQQLRDVGLGHLGGAGELALLQTKCLQPLPDHE